MSNNHNEQSVPYAEGAEEALAGTAIINPEVIAQVDIKPDDFFLLRNSYVWKAMQRLQDRGDAIDYLTVINEVKNMGYLDEIGGIAYITKLANSPASSVHGGVYADIVERTAIRRELIVASDEIRRLAYEEEQTLELVLALAEDELFQVTDKIKPHKETNAQQAMEQAARTLAERQALMKVNPNYIVGFCTGFKLLDKMLDGLRRGEVNVWAGITSSGKTALFLTVALYQLQKGIYHAEYKPAKLAVFSGEMSQEVLNNRLLSIQSNVPVRKIERGNLDKVEAAKVKVAQDTIAQMSIEFLDAKRVTPSELRAWLRRLKHQDKVDVVWLDGLKQIKAESKESQMYLRMAETLVTLEHIAADLDVSINVTHQLSREPRKRPDHAPILSDLGWSSGVEESAARVLMLHRPYMFDTSVSPQTAELYCRKNRHGGTDMIPLTFWPTVTTFRGGIHKQVVER